MTLLSNKSLASGILAALTVAPVLAFAEESKSRFITIKYSKEELAAASNSNFIHASDLGDVLVSKFTLIMTAVTQRQSGSNTKIRSVASEANEPSKQAYYKKLATLKYNPETQEARGDTEKLRLAMSQQYRKATEVKFKDAFPVFEQIRKGLNFKLNLASPASIMPQKNIAPEIRYGLVETDIIPAESSVSLASLSRSSELDSGYSSPAKVVYTIDKLDSYESRKVFTDMSSEESQTNIVQSTSIWNKTPSPNINVKIDAADQEAAVSDQVGQGAVPKARVTVSQADGLISTQILAGSNVSKDSMVTEVKLPVYGEMSVSRKYNAKLKSTNTSALNILGESALPRVNIHYAHTENKYKGEWIVKKDRFEYNVTAEPRQGWGNEEPSLGKVGDKVSFGIQTSF